MNFPRTLLLITSFMAWNTASAQFHDASDRDEALGMMLSTEISNKHFMEKCSTSFPKLSAEMTRNENSWKSEATVLSNYQTRLSDLESRNPALVAALRSQLLLASKTQHQALLATPETYRQYCQTRFADLASGIWRKRTPNAYRFLEK